MMKKKNFHLVGLTDAEREEILKMNSISIRTK